MPAHQLLVDALAHDLRLAFRLLRRSPAFTLVATIALSLGIGANTAIFSVVHGVLLRPLPYPDAQALVTLWHSYRVLDRASVSVPAFLDYQERNQVFESMAAITMVNLNLTGQGDPERLEGRLVSGGFLRTMGVQPMIGRDFLEEEDAPGRNRVVLLSHGLWQRRFGGDPAIGGRLVTLNNEGYEVAGVMPPGFDFPRQAEAWVPIGFTAEQRSPHMRGHEFLTVVARLPDGVSFGQARADIDRLSNLMAREHYPAEAGWSLQIAPLQADSVRTARPALVVLLAAVGLLLLVACANVANLLLARAGARERELAVRAAVGAGRGRLVRQLLTESVVLAGVGGAAGLLVAWLGLHVLVGLAPASIPRIGEIAIDVRVLAFTAAVTMLTGLIFGLMPALQASRVDLHDGLKEGSRGSAGGRNRVRSLLAAGEVALAVVLLAGAVLLVRSFLHVLAVDPGFVTDRVVSFRVALPETRYAEPAQRAAFYDRLTGALAALPGVRTAGAIDVLPLSGFASNATFYLEGLQAAPGESPPHGDPRSVTPGYFQAMGVPVIGGRAFTDRDAADTTPVAVIDDEVVRRYFSDENPIGRRLAFGFEGGPDAPHWREIIGVVRNVKHYGLDGDSRMHVYLPHAQRPSSQMFLAVRGEADPVLLVPSIRSAVGDIDPAQPIFDVQTMDERLEGSLGQRRFTVLLLAIFAGVSLLLAAVGLYGVLAYAVSQRTREFGIRMALGARPADVRRLVIRQGLVVVAAGVAAGVAAAVVATRLLSALLFGISATDAETFTAIAVFVGGVALVAAWLPARRATRVDPLVALRCE